MTADDKTVNTEPKHSVYSYISSSCPDITVCMLNKIKYCYTVSPQKATVCLRKECSEKCVYCYLLLETNNKPVSHLPCQNIRALNKGLISA